MPTLESTVCDFWEALAHAVVPGGPSKELLACMHMLLEGHMSEQY
jgi:hypothetical protein